jgi:hypothetical protein
MVIAGPRARLRPDRARRGVCAGAPIGPRSGRRGASRRRSAGIERGREAVRETGAVRREAARGHTDVDAPARGRRALGFFRVAVRVGCKTASSACGPLTFRCRPETILRRWSSRRGAALDHGNTRQLRGPRASATRGAGCPSACHGRAPPRIPAAARAAGPRPDDGARPMKTAGGANVSRADDPRVSAPAFDPHAAPFARPPVMVLRRRGGHLDRVSSSNIGLIHRSPQWLIAQSTGDIALTAFDTPAPGGW